MKPVGFIGLGNMGAFMAKNLLKQGYPLVVHDVYPEAVTELQDLGALVAESAADVAEKVDRIVTMLPSSPNVIEAYNSNNGILSWVQRVLRSNCVHGKVRSGILSLTIDHECNRNVINVQMVHPLLPVPRSYRNLGVIPG